MCKLVPLLPAWVVGLWVLVAAPGVWEPDSLGTNLQGNSMAAGWILLGGLVMGSVLYAWAPVFGRRLAVSSSSSITVGMGPANAGQEALGAALVRVGSLVGLYLLVGCLSLRFLGNLGA